jgi:hypothetical protein
MQNYPEVAGTYEIDRPWREDGTKYYYLNKAFRTNINHLVSRYDRGLRIIADCALSLSGFSAQFCYRNHASSLLSSFQANRRVMDCIIAGQQ